MTDELDSALEQLQALEVEIQDADVKVEDFKTQLFTPIYNKRRLLTQKVPKFWYVVLAQHEDFQEYVRLEDMQYLESIADIHVEHWTKPGAETEVQNQKITIPRKGFTLFIKFEKAKDLKEQSISKDFEWKLDNKGNRNLISCAVEVEWPSSLNNINPILIKETAKADKRAISSSEKKLYRLGMRSFWAFFSWTGEKEGKEFRNGEELALLIAEDIFPAALDYYVLAMPGLGEENGDIEEVESGEELDLSGEEDDQEPVQKKQKT